MTVPRRAARAAVALLAAVALFGAPASATADDGGRLLLDVPGDGEGFVSHTSKPVIQTSRLAPGYSTTGALVLKNDSSTPAHVRLQTVRVRDDDNGCNRPETRDGDTTCGQGGGELSDWLEATVSRSSNGSTQALWHGSLSALAVGVDLPDEIKAGATWPLRLTLELPYAAPNQTQTDRVGFGLRWSASADVAGVRPPSSAEVLGTEAFAAGTSDTGPVIGGGRGVPLPFTGAEIGIRLLLTDAGLLAAGVALLFSSRRRRLGTGGAHALRR